MKALIVALLCLIVGFGVALVLLKSDEESLSETAELGIAKAPPIQDKQEAPKKPLLDFDDVPLSEIVRALNQNNATQIEFADSAIGEIRITASLRSGNSETLVRLLELTMDLRAEHVNESKVVLHRKDSD